MDGIKIIRLRPVKISDAEFLFECDQDEEAKKNFTSTPKNVKDVRNNIRRALKEMRKGRPREELLAVEWKRKCVGQCWIIELNNKHMEHKACIGIGLHKDFRGRGIGTAALKLLTKYAISKYRLKRIYTYVNASNKGSRRMLEKVGYKLEGIMKKDEFNDGKYIDDCIYAYVR